MYLAIIESPFAGNIERNILYARFAARDALIYHGEAPFLSHLLYPQPCILNDHDQDERRMGITAGHQWMLRADLVAVYTDLGESPGMAQGIKMAKRCGITVKYRRIHNDLWHEMVRVRPDLFPELTPIPEPGIDANSPVSDTRPASLDRSLPDAGSGRIPTRPTAWCEPCGE